MLRNQLGCGAFLRLGPAVYYFALVSCFCVKFQLFVQLYGL